MITMALFIAVIGTVLMLLWTMQRRLMYFPVWCKKTAGASESPRQRG